MKSNTFTRVHKAIAEYNNRQIIFKVWERNITVGILVIALVYFGVHIINLIK